MPRYDCIVVGSGPAGLEAALNLKIRNKSFLLFGKPELSKKITLAPKIDNYLGLPSITGQGMAEAFHRHLDHMGISITHEMISSVYPMGDYFSVASNYNLYEATSIILATGVSAAKTFPGEEEFLGRGVGYCATCDAPLYKGKNVAVIGYGNDAVMETNFISELAAKTYYIPMAKYTLPINPEVEVLTGSVTGIKGGNTVDSLELKDRTLEVDGIFILRESISPISLLPGLEVNNGFIGVDADMKTNLPGCFAAGDCTGKPHQYIRAAGQGLTAAFSAVHYIDDMKTQE